MKVTTDMKIIIDGIEIDESELDEVYAGNYVDPNEMEEPILVLDEDGFLVPEYEVVPEEDCN